MKPNKETVYDSWKFMGLLLTCGLVMVSTIGVAWEMTFARSTPRIHGDPEEEGGVNYSPSIQALVVTHDGVLFAGSFGMGISRSTNNGKTWESMNEGLTDLFVLSLAVDTQGRVYAGTVRGGVYRLSDDAPRWKSIKAGLKRVEVKSLLANKTGVFAGTGRGVYRWDESRMTWHILAEELDQLLIASLAMMKDKILLAATSGKGLFRYDVSGATASKWQGHASDLVDPKERLHHRFLRIVAIGRKDDIFLGTQDGGIFRSTDHGASWHTISRTLPNDSIRSIVIDDSELFVGTGRGVYVFDKATRRWKSLNSGLTEQSIQTLIVSPTGILYAGTSSGAFRSDDRGGTWSNVSAGLGQVRSRSGPF